MTQNETFQKTDECRDLLVIQPDHLQGSSLILHFWFLHLLFLHRIDEMIKKIVYTLLVSVFGLFAQNSKAGIFEIGASGNYRISRLDRNNYQEMESYTGSISYYFWENSALELSYTSGTQIVVLKITGENMAITTTSFQMMGADLVLSLASKESFIQPYIKAGAALTRKKMTREIENQGVDELPISEGLVPSAGIGVKFKISNTMSLKLGVDGWTSPSNQKPTTIDYAGRAGISWLF